MSFMSICILYHYVNNVKNPKIIVYKLLLFHVIIRDYKTMIYIHFITLLFIEKIIRYIEVKLHFI